MWRNLSLLMFVVVLGGCAAFVWITSAALPPVVASHFAASGRANGFAPYEIYVRFMLGMIVVVPGLSVIIPRLGINRPNARINLPNGAYWLAPARRQDTIDYLCGHMAVFGMMLALFLTYVHWMVLAANLHTPPDLPGEAFLQAMAGFIAAVVVWVILMFRRFRRVAG